MRSAIIGKIAFKCNTTSFPNTLDADFIKLREKAHMACAGNSEATESVWQTVTLLLQNAGGLLVYLAILSRLDPALMAVVIVTCIISFLISRYVNRWTFAHRDTREIYYAKKQYISNKAESVELAKDIRIFGLQDWLNDLLMNVHDVYLDYRLKEERIKLMADITEAVMTAARNGIAYVYLIRMALREGLGVPEFLLYFTAVTTFTAWVMGLLQQAVRLQEQSLDISCVREFLEYPEPFRFEEGKPVPNGERYELRLENVSFRYPCAREDTIRNLNLIIHPGEKLAVVGLNGAGKTTLVRLLCGLFDPTQGRVLLNGQDIREFNRREYYGLFSAVFQEFSVLDVTVAENIAQTNQQIDYDRVKSCIENAGLSGTVAELPNGLETHVGREVYLDGALFSGGQTQRLILARALYKNAPVLILDEPTAALDPIAEAEIYSRLDEITGDKTAIYISHRLSSCKFCDEIAVFHEGCLIEKGSHDELVGNKDSKYHELWTAQAQYYTE